MARWVSFGLLAVLILGELDEYWWFAGLFSHFRYHYLAVALIFLIPVVIRRSWLTLALLGLVIAANVWVIASVQRAPAASDQSGGVRLRIATLNLSYDNKTPARAISYLLASKAEIVFLQEVVPEHFKAIEVLARKLPHTSPRDWRSGAENIILSKWPLEEAAMVAAPARYSSATVAAVRIKGHDVRLLSLHPYPPMSPASNVEHRAALAHYASMVNARPGHWIVGGDFNTTPWSPRFRRLVSRSGLRLSGLQWAWPQSWPTPQSFGGPIIFSCRHSDRSSVDQFGVQGCRASPRPLGRVDTRSPGGRPPNDRWPRPLTVNLRRRPVPAIRQRCRR